MALYVSQKKKKAPLLFLVFNVVLMTNEKCLEKCYRFTCCRQIGNGLQKPNLFTFGIELSWGLGKSYTPCTVYTTHAVNSNPAHMWFFTFTPYLSKTFTWTSMSNPGMFILFLTGFLILNAIPNYEFSFCRLDSFLAPPFWGNLLSLKHTYFLLGDSPNIHYTFFLS